MTSSRLAVRVTKNSGPLIKNTTARDRNRWRAVTLRVFPNRGHDPQNCGQQYKEEELPKYPL